MNQFSKQYFGHDEVEYAADAVSNLEIIDENFDVEKEQ